jgi:glycosyltransferase involved in cell wall biosynthesis
VDNNLFRPSNKEGLNMPRPVSVYLGRLAVEKNIEAFLSLELPGSKLVIGEGPDLGRLRDLYPGVRFTGQKLGAELAATLAQGDVLVFPSLTDTYGLVMLEAMACGLPVAAHPVPGPYDVIQQGITGVMNTDLREAVIQALKLDPLDCVAYARQYSWRQCSEQFISYMEPISLSVKCRFKKAELR